MVTPSLQSAPELTKADLKPLGIEYLWSVGDLSYKLWPQQRPIYDSIKKLPSNCETVVILCSRQYGKSHLGVINALEDCIRYQNHCVLIVGPTIKQTVEIVAPRIRDITKDAPPGFIRRSKAETKWYVGSSELVIGGFDQSSSAQRGKTVQNIYIEEIVDSNPDQYIDSMKSDLGPALTHSKGGKMIFLTTPPKIPAHPFLLDTVPQAKLSGSFYCYTIDDNTQLSTEQYDACIRRSGGRESIEFRREYLCEIVRDDKTTLVPDFSRCRHVKNVSRVGEGFYTTSIDFGGVKDKTVALICVYDFVRAKLLVFAERVFGANTPTSSILAGLEVIEREYQVSDRIADCPPQLAIDLRSVGYNVRIPTKYDWQAGVNAVQVGFSQDNIEIDPSCHILIETLDSGQFNKNKTDFQRTEALGHCDAFAALMYAWRSVQKHNPYAEFFQASSQSFVRHSAEPAISGMSDAIQPKTFGSSQFGKRLGSFK